MSTLAVVAIGRNEGERLVRCLESLQDSNALLVYVDSGSSDDSVTNARNLGAEIVVLDPSLGFTAARARNAGFERAMELAPELELVQFVDGDCEIDKSWIEAASRFLHTTPEVAAVAGRRRERYPEASVYNQLCDWEWSVKPGPAQYFGGDVMLRVEALAPLGGYRDTLIAGEEPELCVRLRGAGWKIHILPIEMTLHDAAMTRFSQWFRRTVRSGYAYAAGAWLHGAAPERHWVWQSVRAWAWALFLPVFILLVTALVGPWALLGFLIYPLQVVRLMLRDSGRLRNRWIRACFNTLSRFPEWVGQCRFLADVALRRSEIIEYK